MSCTVGYYTPSGSADWMNTQKGASFVEKTDFSWQFEG